MQGAISPEMESLRAENRELLELLKKKKTSEGYISELMSDVLTAVKAEKPVKIPVPRGVDAPGKSVTLVLHLTDWHIGLTTPASLIEEFGEFNWRIAQRRVAQLVKAVAKYTTVMRSGYTIDDCVVLGTADWTSGDIHEGLVRTNEFPAPVQAVKAGRLLGATIMSLAEIFPRVRAEIIDPGNHDRLTKKPQAQAGGFNSWGYVVGALAQDLLSQQTNVTFNHYPEMQTIVDVMGRRYLIGHGDGIIGTWGIPFYGIERKKMREATARMNMIEAKRFHKIVIGHFHTALDHEDWFIGGSLPGTDENDHKQGRHSKAHQTSWLVHPTHGEFGFTRWYLD